MRRSVLVVGAVLVVTGCTAATPHRVEASRAASGSASPVPPASPSQSAAHPRLRVRRTPWRLPQPVAREAVIPQSAGRLMVGGGLLAGDVSSAASYELDLANGRATALQDLPTAVHDTAGARIGGRDVVVGGGNASEQAVLQSRFGKRWRTTGRLPGPRSDLSTVTVGATAYVVGGYDGTSPALPEVLASRDGDRWRTVARLRVPVRYAATVAQGGAIWVLGGEVSGHMVDTVQRIDPGAGRARVVGHLPRPLGHAAAVVLGDRVLVAGGRTTQDALTSRMWWFDPSTRTFTRAGRLPTPLADSAVVSAGGSAYLVGGETPGFSDRVLRLSYR